MSPSKPAKPSKPLSSQRLSRRKVQSRKPAQRRKPSGEQPETGRLYTTREAGAILGLDPDSVTTYINRKQLPAIKPGHDWLIQGADLAAFMQQPRSRGRRAKDVTAQTSSSGSSDEVQV